MLLMFITFLFVKICLSDFLFFKLLKYNDGHNFFGITKWPYEKLQKDHQYIEKYTFTIKIKDL